MKKMGILAIVFLYGMVALGQTKTFKGAWFDIQYPANFKAISSQKSASAEGAESAFFRSPDGLVEFYVFSPQWSGVAKDIVLKSTEKMASETSQKSGDNTVIWWTITDKKGAYTRSYQETKNEALNVNWIVGIRYKNQPALGKYKAAYASFKKSLVQYAD